MIDQTLIEQALTADPLQSDREVARLLGTSHKRVGRIRGELERAGVIEAAERRRDPRSGELTQPAARRVVRGMVSDPLWPTDNDLDIPALLPALAAGAVERPIRRWSERKRGRAGLLHFYEDDHRFAGLWHYPDRLLAAGVGAIVEPNFSAADDMPRIAGLYQIYKKRWLARYAQHHGIRVFVDLNVGRGFYRDNLLGVPAGWSSFATRAYADRLDDTIDEYGIACRHAGGPVLFVVIGGGADARQLSREFGWVWVSGGYR